MVTDKKEKNRKLSPAEQRRQIRYEQLSEDYMNRGYKRTELTVGIVAANIFALLYGLPLMVAGLIIFFMRHPAREWNFRFFPDYIIFIVLLIVFIFIHELIHGITWAVFTDGHFKDIEFGFMKEYLTPYCTCACPLTKGKYIIGALMPLLILGIIPMVLAIIGGSFMWLLLGIIMTISAGGDIMIVINILRYKTDSDDVVYIDHPTQAGGVIFER